MKINKIRIITQLLIFFFILVMVFNFGIFKIHYSCPFSLNCVLLSAFAGGFFSLFLGFVLGGLILLSTMIWGRYFCGWVCPIGFIQDLLSLIKKKSLNVPRWLYSFKYLIFIVISIGTYFSGKIIYSAFCPVINLTSISYNIGFFSIIIIFIFSIFYFRFFCKVFCPFAALMNIFQFIILKISRGRFPIGISPDKCVNCKLCEKACPHDFNVCKMDTFERVECFRDLDCLMVCPTCKIKKNK